MLLQRVLINFFFERQTTEMPQRKKSGLRYLGGGVCTHASVTSLSA